MKKAFLGVVTALALGVAASAQNSTVDSIAANYKLQPMPAPLTLEKTFPVIGTYQLNGETPGTVTVMLDSSNKGMVWVEGLPQGRIKAYLKKSPATYRILAQKSAAGTSVPEGTLYFDAASNTLNIALGKAYDEVDPTAVFALNPNAAGVTAMAPGTEIKTEIEGPQGETKVKTEVEKDGTVKTKTKTPAGKTKSKVMYFTAVKVVNNTDASTQPATGMQQ